MNFKFKIHEREKSEGTTFGDPTMIVQGKEININKMIQENREDTEIYAVLEKYGSLKKIALDKQGVFGNLKKIKGLTDIFEIQKQAKKMWENLPVEVRREFNHNEKEFIEKGQEWLEKKIEAEKPKEEPKTKKDEDIQIL